MLQYKFLRKLTVSAEKNRCQWSVDAYCKNNISLYFFNRWASTFCPNHFESTATFSRHNDFTGQPYAVRLHFNFPVSLCYYKLLLYSLPVTNKISVAYKSPTTSLSS